MHYWSVPLHSKRKHSKRGLMALSRITVVVWSPEQCSLEVLSHAACSYGGKTIATMQTVQYHAHLVAVLVRFLTVISLSLWEALTNQ